MARQLVYSALLVSSVSFAQPSPAFYWKLDGTSGNTATAATGGSDGTLVGGVLWDPAGGHHQGAARFDGVNDRIVFGACDLTNGGDVMSISLWIKPDFVTGMERTLIAKTVGPTAADHVWSIALINSTALRFRLKTGGTTTELSTAPSSLSGGTWYHMVAVYDGTQMRVYTNGSLMGAVPKSGSIGYHPQAPASLGATSTGTEPFSGWIDDVRVYDFALSDLDIMNILFEGVTTAIPGHAIACTPTTFAQLASGYEQVTLSDAMGRTVLHRSLNTSSNVELPSLSAGIYLVCFQGHGTRTATRMVVP